MPKNYVTKNNYGKSALNIHLQEINRSCSIVIENYKTKSIQVPQLTKGIYFKLGFKITLL